MKIYIAYKLSNTDFAFLKDMLMKIDSIIKELGHETFIFVRDIQNWQPVQTDPKIVMTKAMANMKKCDAIITVIQSVEKGEGLMLESGFMKGIGKKVIVANGPNSRAILLNGMADFSFEYKDLDEFKEKLRKILG